MGLYERLIGLEEPKIAVHQYAAAMNEVQRGKLTKADLQTMFKLDTAEKTDSDALVTRTMDVLSPVTGDVLHEVLLLAEARLTYADTTSLKTRLGV